MAWTDIPDTNIEPDKPILATDILAIRDNITAQANGDPGAPQQQTAGIADLAVTNAKLATGAVTQQKIANGAVGQSQLKTTEANYSVKTLSEATGGPRFVSFTTLSGQYGFHPTLKTEGSGTPTVFAYIERNGYDNGSGRVGRITVGGGGTSDKDAYVYQRYVQACPPYDLGDGEVPQFIFAMVNANGVIEAVCSGQEAPWHNNGPTDIRADYYDKHGRGWREEPITETTIETDEDGDPIPVIRRVGARTIEITQEMKQADMTLIPHPFGGNDMTGKTIILIDPVCRLTHTLAEMHREGTSANRLLHEDYIRIGNDALTRKGPPGVMIVKPKWRNTKSQR